ncbi:MAG TPA: OB-fold nucleic acid binding domain-containing protein, partial [Solirubrobacterales bacterium]|nr:OB-fold nucleic acid binding domain-containing protein [Solirubrobacterales bacterium]
MIGPRALGGGPVTHQELLDAPVRWPRPSLLRKPLDVSDRTREAAANLGIETLGDLFEHVPAGHEFRAGSAIADLKSGDEATIEATVTSISLRPTRRRNFRIVEARVKDDSGSTKAVWFNQAYLIKQLEPGTKVRLFGAVKAGSFQVREHTILGGGVAAGQSGIVSVYPGTEGLKSQRLRELVDEQRGLELHTIEPLPGSMRAHERLTDRAAALAHMHFPRDARASSAGRHRLAFEELLMQQLALG